MPKQRSRCRFCDRAAVSDYHSIAHCQHHGQRARAYARQELERLTIEAKAGRLEAEVRRRQ